MIRLVTLTYGVVCYLLAMVTILYAIGFIGGFAPISLDPCGPATERSKAVLIDLVLRVIFAIQHSVMARPGFKAAWTRIVPPAIERSTYILCASLVLALLYSQWRTVRRVVWSVTGPAAVTLMVVFWIGWAVLFISTFLINHFDLFG